MGNLITPSRHFHVLNGKLINEEALLISPRDIGFLRGYGVFEFFITYQKSRPFHLNDHLDRLFSSAKGIGLEPQYTKEQVKAWTLQALESSYDGLEKSVRILLTGGLSEDSITPNPTQQTLIIIVDPHKPPKESLYVEGSKIQTHLFVRPLPTVKSLNYVQAVPLLQQAKNKGCIEVVYYDNERVYEGTTSNIFALVNGKLLTPKTDVLGGITRKVLLNILSLAESVELADFALPDLLNAQEVFLTASNKEVMPVTFIDDRPVGSGKVGKLCKEIMRQFRAYTASSLW